MSEVSPAQLDAVLAHLSAAYDAAAAAALARDYGWWNSDLGPQLAKSIRDTKANELRILTATAQKHPENFAQAAIDAERDLKDLSGYSADSTVQAVLAATAQATAQQVESGVSAAAGFSLGLIPWWVKLGGGAVLLALLWFEVRPFLPALPAHKAAS